MKRLTLVRHAAAESKHGGMSDSERPLNRTGLGEAEALGKRLLQEQLIPDLLIASSARRTRQTAEILARELGLAAHSLKIEAQLYLARAEDILRVIRAVDSNVRHLMVVGHNPGISKLASMLSSKTRITELHTAQACTVNYPQSASGQLIAPSA